MRATTDLNIINKYGQHSRGKMLYSAHEFQRTWLAGASYLAQMQAGWLRNPANPLSYLGAGTAMAAALEVFAHAGWKRH